MPARAVDRTALHAGHTVEDEADSRRRTDAHPGLVIGIRGSVEALRRPGILGIMRRLVSAGDEDQTIPGT
jgi:hypothetical protein